MAPEAAVSALYGKTRSLTLLFLTIVCVSAFLLRNARFGSSVDAAGMYSVITYHYGVNAEEIEQSITIPLENLVADLPGIREMRSTSEFGQSRVILRLHGEVDPARFYLALRDRVSRAQARFPRSAQKPQIVSSSRSHRPVFIAAFSSTLIDNSRLRDLIEKELKPELQRIPGTGEIEIGGGGLQEIQIEVAPGKASSYDITPPLVASALQSQHLFVPLGSLRQQRFDYPVTLTGRFESLEAIRGLRLPTPGGGSIQLGEIASVSYTHRYPESVSRVDGSQRVVAYVYGGGQANLILLSRAIRNTIRSFQQAGYEVSTIYDQGVRMEEGLREVAVAIGIGILSLTVFLLLLLPNLRLVLLLSLEFPLVVYLSAAVLTALGVSIDRHILVGMAVGNGLIIDISLVISHAMTQSPPWPVRRLFAPLLSSTVTTLIVFLPLYAMEPAAPGIRSISLAISVMLIIAMILSFLFLPPFFLSGAIRASGKPPAPRLLAELKSLYARYVRRSLLRPLPFLAGFGLALAGCVLAFVLAPKKLSFSERDTVLFAQLEFPSGTNLGTVDRRTTAFVQTLLDAPFITRVQSQAKRGKAELSVEYRPSRIDESSLIRYLKEKAPSVPQGFLFFDEPSPREGVRLECAITGYDHQALKTLARNMVQDLVAQDWVTDGVLHFKDDPPALIFRPDMERLFGSKLTLSEVASALRWNVQGPVALKWIQEGREMDLRVFGEKRGRLGREDLASFPVSSGGGGTVRLAQLGSLQAGVEPARLYRLNRQNAIFFSVTVTVQDLELLTQRIRAVVERAHLPIGYGFVLDQDLRETQKRFRFVWLLFLVAIFLVYVVIAVQTESFQAPLLILSIVPLSVGVPAVLLAVFGTALELSVIIGCIILSGMAVNNSILIYDGYQAARAGEKEANQGILKAMFGRLKPLVLTSGTTVIGSVPLLIAAGGVTGFSGTLAFVIIFGVTAAVLASLLFLPVLLQLSTLSRRSLRLPSDSSLRRSR